MKMTIFLITCFMCSLIELSTTADIQCEYKEYDLSSYNAGKYACDVSNDPNIRTKQDSMVNSISGSHTNGRNNDDVNIFKAESKSIEYFPQGLEKFYKNIKGINIDNCKLKEIHQSDLKPFTKLTLLEVYYNDIEVLEEGLFDYNPDLAHILMYNNKISQIYSNIFDHLTKLATLYLQLNKCTVSLSSYQNSTRTKQVITQMKTNCPSPPRSTTTTSTITTTTTPAPVTCPPPPTPNPEIFSNYETQITTLNNEINTLKENFCIRELNSTIRVIQNDFRETMGQQAKDIENSAIKFQEQIKISQNLTTIDFGDRLELIEDRMNNLVAVNTKSLNDVNIKFVDLQYKLDIRLNQFEKKLMDKVAEKFEEMQMEKLQSKMVDVENKMNEKLDIIIKALNNHC